jgi:hypothetical protein
MALVTPTSELEAVNIMLSAIGESPVSTLNNASLVDVSLAQSILKETSVDIQSQGLHCNTEINYPLVPNVSGEVIIPNNCVRIDTTEASADVDVTQRGNRLYDRKERSFNSFSGTLYVEMVLLLDFSDLPQHVRRYATVKAARRFQARYVGSQTLGGFTEVDEREALVQFERAEKLNEDNNILSDNFDTYKILSRGSPRRAVRF